MASPTDPTSAAAAIGGRFVVDTSQPLPLAGGGVPAYAATDLTTGNRGFMALQADRYLPVRAEALRVLTAPVGAVLTPVAYGRAPAANRDIGYFVICPAPPGPPVSENLGPWPEAALMEHVLRPVAHALDALQLRGVTHRAIRLNNVFRGGPHQPVMLGAAWAAPAALHQPAVFEPPYVGMCLPSGRGEGSIADDVYALGVLLLVLALGRVPMAGLDETAVILRKLELGSHAALAGDVRLPPAIGDLVRGMLAEDPEHRPTPALLLDAGAARGRRVTARPPRRAQRPFQVGEIPVWNSRTLVYAMATAQSEGVRVLRDGSATQWVRRGLGDAQLAGRMEDHLRRLDVEERRRGVLDPGMLTQIAAIVDPLAPMCWGGHPVWPDGVVPAIAAALRDAPGIVASLYEAFTAEIVLVWALLRDERSHRGDLQDLRTTLRQQRTWLETRGPMGGVPRLIYMALPLQPCLSPTAERACVIEAADLMPLLETIAASLQGQQELLDTHLIAFMAARLDRGLQRDLAGLADGKPGQARAMAILHVLHGMQIRYAPRPLPALTGWMVAHAEALVTAWANRTRRAAVAEQLAHLGPGGLFAPIVALLGDLDALGDDQAGARRAAAELTQIDGELESIATGAEMRHARAVQLGRDATAAIGMIVLFVLVAMAALGK